MLKVLWWDCWYGVVVFGSRVWIYLFGYDLGFINLYGMFFWCWWSFVFVKGIGKNVGRMRFVVSVLLFSVFMVLIVYCI